MTSKSATPEADPPEGRLAVIATSFRRIGLGPLARFTLAPDATSERRALREALGAAELVYLSTCNRVECHVAFDPGLVPSPATLLERARAFFGRSGGEVEPGALRVATGHAAVTHLLEVASGLDSLLLGETEVCGQVRRALERSTREGLSGPTLARLFERAAACSRRIKNETTLARQPASAATIAMQKVRKYFGSEGPAVTVLVGAGEMTVKVARELAGKRGERIFANRTRAKADELARRFGGVAMSLDELLAAPPPRIDLLFAATSATETVIPARVLEPALADRRAAGRPLVVCDLGLPRDVDPAVDALPGVLLVDMRSIQTWAEGARLEADAGTGAARVIVAEEVARFVREERFRAIADGSARGLLDDALGHLAPDDRDSVLRFAVGLASRIARQPV